MSNPLLTIARDVPLPTTEKLLLLLIADRAHDNGRMFTSVARLAHECTTTERTVQRTMRDLEARGLVAVVGNVSGGRGLSRTYAINIARLKASAEPYQNGDADDTLSAEKGDTSVAVSPDIESERVTPMVKRVTPVTEKGDTGVTPTTLNPVEPHSADSPPAPPLHVDAEPVEQPRQPGDLFAVLPEPEPPPRPKRNPSAEATPMNGAKNDAGRGHTRGTRLPPDWQPAAVDRAYAVERGLDPDYVAECFRDFWHAKPGAGGVKLDWHATWRTWCRRAAEDRAGRPRAGGDRPRPGGLVEATARVMARHRAQGAV